MADKPILFSAPMVQAILREIRMPGTGKTQTRRILNPQPFPAGYDYFGGIEMRPFPQDDGTLGCRFSATAVGGGAVVTDWIETPIGVGDRLWVREMCRAEELPGDGADGVRYQADDAFVPIANSSTASLRWLELHTYRNQRGAAVPSIHMPRWASRITLIVTDVRVQWLQDISEADAIAEGVEPVDPPSAGFEGSWSMYHDEPEGGGAWSTASASFRSLWNSINGPRAWAANPWVAAYTFRPILTNIDALKETA